MSWTKTAIRQPVLVNLLSVLVLVAGALYASANTTEIYPDIEPPGVLVTAAYPGVAAEEVEKLISRPLEDAVADVDGVAHVYSTSRNGLSTLWVELASGTNRDRAVLDVQSRVSEARADLPPDAKAPRVRTGTHMVPVIQVALSGPPSGDPATLRAEARRLQEKLETLPAVDSVQAAGLRTREIRVIPDPDALEAHDLSLTELAQAIAARNRNLPGGTVATEGREVSLRAQSEYTSLDDIRQVVVRARPDGQHLRVANVAEVRDTFADRHTSGWVDGRPAVLLSVAKQKGADAHAVVAKVRRILAETANRLPEGYGVRTFGDTTKAVDRSLDVLIQNGIMGMVLVLALLWLFLGFRNALFAALGLPFALGGALIVMYLLGVTINQLSLFALILCVGILVDDAIVVVENVARHREQGLTPRVAALLGTKEVLWPVAASVLTTIAAFLPMLLVSGPFGDFLGVIPKVVVAALTASLIEAVFVLPSHLAEYPGRVRTTAASRWLDRFARRGYRPTARLALRLRYVLVPGLLALAVGLSALALSRSQVALFQGDDGEQFDVRVEMPSGTSLSETERVLRQVEAVVRSLPRSELDATLTQSGWSRTNLFPVTGSQRGMVTAVLSPAGSRARSTQEIMDSLRARVARIAGPLRPPELVEGGFRPPTGDPVAIRLQGDDLGRLEGLARKVESTLRTIPGVRDVGRDYHLGNTELRLVVDEDLAALHGLSTARVAQALYTAYQGHAASRYRAGDEEVDVVVRYPAALRRDPSRIAALSLRPPPARTRRPSAIGHALPRVPVGDVASLQRSPAPASIVRRDRRRTITVTARLRPGTTSDGVNRAAQRKLASLQAANPDVHVTYGGEFERLNESTRDLGRAFLVALLIIYLILAAQFRSFLQPAVVLLALPLAAIGVAIGFLASGEVISFVALLGLVGLAGIVVNDSLVLVDFVNQRRRAGAPRRDALLEAGAYRLRPILLTSITTLAGLLPMSLGLFGDAGGLAPMATAMVWGLSFSTVLTLYAVPAAYAVVDDLSAALHRLLGRARTLAEPDDGLDALDPLPLKQAFSKTRQLIP